MVYMRSETSVNFTDVLMERESVSESSITVFQFNSNILLNKVHKFNYTISIGIAHHTIAYVSALPQ
jgi:hypothetical protein